VYVARYEICSLQISYAFVAYPKKKYLMLLLIWR